MAHVSDNGGLPGLPTEILEQILTKALRYDHQTAGYCSCAGKKRDCFNRKVEIDYQTARVDFKLVNKTFCNVIRNIPPSTITAVVCSVACLKRLLSYMNQERFRDRLRTVIVEEKRRFPVDVCDHNRYHLCEVAVQWIKKLAEQCGDALKAEGFVSIWSSSDMAARSVNEWTSVVPLKVQRDIVWRQKK